MLGVKEKRLQVKERFSQRVLEHVLILYVGKAECDAGPTCMLSVQELSDALFAPNKPFPQNVHPFFADEEIMKPICDTLAHEIQNKVAMKDGFLLLDYPEP
jgi:hypothetical protein